MKKILKAGIAVMATLVISCSSDTHEESSTYGNVEVRFSSLIETRVSGTQWDAGDGVGVYMFRSGEGLSDASICENSANNKYVASATGALSPASEMDKLFYPMYESVDFVAYYPYGDVADYELALDVSEQGNQEKLDLLYSKNLTSVEATSEAQKLVFKHKLSKIVFNVKAGLGYESTDLEGAEICLKGAFSNATFSLANGGLTLGNEKQNINLTTSAAGDGVMAEAIVLPQSCGGMQVYVSMVSGVTKRFDFISNHQWLEGYKYEYEITLVDNETGALLEAEITEWTVGETAGSVQEVTPEPWSGTVDTDWFVAENVMLNLYTSEEMAGLAKLVNEGNSFEGKTIQLCNDLDMNSQTWTPIGVNADNSFKGSFEGNGHQIRGLAFVTNASGNGGLFGFSTGTIKNLSVKGTTSIASSERRLIYVGGVVGTNEGTVSGCRNYVAINTSVTAVSGGNETNPYTGGIAGMNSGTITGCQNYAVLSSKNVNTDAIAYLHLGGISGSNTGAISDCRNMQTLTATNGNVRIGGITGLATGTSVSVVDCQNVGRITVESSHNECSSGGIVGKLANGAEIKACVNGGNMTSILTSGTKIYGGGLAGLNTGGVILSGSNSGTILVTGVSGSGTLAAAGGVVGYNTTGAAVHKATNEGSASSSGASNNYAGGIGGYNDAESDIYTCCSNAGLPTLWVGNATGDDNLLTDTDHTDE